MHEHSHSRRKSKHRHSHSVPNPEEQNLPSPTLSEDPHSRFAYRQPSTAIPRGNVRTIPPNPKYHSPSIIEKYSPQEIPVHRVHVDLPEHNSSTDLVSWKNGLEFKWALTGSSWITEAQNFYMIGRDGSLIFMQIGYSNLGWPSTTCQISGRYFKAAQDTNVFVSKNISALKMKMSKDFTGVSANKASLEHFHIGNDQLAIIKAVFDESELKFELNLRPEAQPFQVADGNIYFGQNRSDGFVNMKFLTACHTTGFFELPGITAVEPFEGYALVVHQFQGVRPHLCASSWNLCYFVSDTPRSGMCPSTLFMIQLQTPDSYDDATINYGAIFHEGNLICVSVGNIVEHGESPIDAESGFPVPKTITYRWKGRGFEGESITATCHVTLASQCARICLLDNVPYMLRKVVETFVAKPFVYQWLDRTEIELQIKDEKTVLKGWIFQELALV